MLRQKQKPTLNYSQNSVKIGFIDKDEYIKIIGYEISDFNFKLQIQQNTTIQDNSTSYVMIDEKDILINDISKQDKTFLESYDLKVVSINEPITEDNKNECYIIEEYKRPYSPDEVNIIKSTHLVKVTDFKWKNQNSIHLVLQKSLPENTVFTGIKIKYPKSMLFGNIKCWGNVNGVYSYPSSNIENASLVPLLSMPIETSPNVRIFQYWFTESFLPWSIAQNYIQGKDILDLVNKNGLEKVLLNYLTYRYNYDRKFQGAKYDEKGNPNNKAAELRQKFEGQKPEDVIDGLFENWKLDNSTSINDQSVKRFKQIIYMLSNYTYSKYAINKGYNDDVKLIAPYYFELISTPNSTTEIGYWLFEHCKVQLNSLYFNFSDNAPIPPEPINYWQEVYANDKPFNTVDNKYYFVVWKTNNWNITKFKNNTLINRWHPSIEIDSKNEDENYKLNLEWIRGHGTIVIRSYSVISDWPAPRFKTIYRWNGIDEPLKPQINPNTGQITDWNLKQQNNINNDDNEIKINSKNKDISENPIYKLEANYFNWLSITNELETNNIPSLIPAEIKLSDGEYGKYLISLIVSNNKIEDYLDYYSQRYRLLYSKTFWMDMTKNLVVDNIKITYDKKLFNLNQIEISGIWGYGSYDINIFIEKPNEKIIEGKYINLELIEKTQIGTKVSGKDRDTYLQLIEFNVWYLYKNGIEDEKSYSNIAVVNFLKQSNSVIFLYPSVREQINIDNLQLFNKNNEKLSLITLEI
ncbi:hypothetical protein [Spiroplasma poulsonii]|uniref:DUF3688 domain-containing protein n=1 Tax=Spiroplasma poulsonii TaxID=2138 RepID=A0A2P6FAX5_9MOLU|nr:hypothetical protein [Spiroplasma poulsonii]KAF0851803.1 putative lipoprotein [Spiroplasma poulsonii]PQM30590.1 hypothetical protein SMSRO_SF003680 [Spiroplasma poulsonii]PWF95569.1 hypothetical protein SMSE_10040 [Spiroplasma poulsonii]PWF98350.1 hypothetical protein SMH99_09100 [Spiroplasma poulsonii]